MLSKNIIKKNFSAKLNYKAIDILSKGGLFNSVSNNQLKSIINNFDNTEKKLSILISNPIGVKLASAHDTENSEKNLPLLYDNNFLSTLLWSFSGQQSFINNLISLEQRKSFFENLLGTSTSNTKGFNTSPVINFSLPNNKNISAKINTKKITEINKDEDNNENTSTSNITLPEEMVQELVLNNQDSTHLLHHLAQSIKETLNLSISNNYDKLSEYEKLQITEFFKAYNNAKTSEELTQVVFYYFNYLTILLTKIYSERPIFIVSDYEKYFNSNDLSVNLKKELDIYSKFISEIIIDNAFVSKAVLTGKSLVLKDIVLNENNYDSFSSDDVNVIFNKTDYSSLNLHNKSCNSVSNSFIKQEAKRQSDLLTSLFKSNEKTYVDSIKSLQAFKESTNNNNNTKANDNISDSFLSEFKEKINSGINIGEKTFLNYLVERYYENIIDIDTTTNELKYSSESGKQLLDSVLFNDINEIRDLPYKIQLAYYYFNYLEKEKVGSFFSHLKTLFNKIADNAKNEKDFEKFPNFSFRTEKELDDYLVDILTLDLNSVHLTNKDRISIYEVEDDSIILSEEIKKFALIIFEDKDFAIYVKGSKLKRSESANTAESDESSVSGLVKVRKAFGASTKVNTTEKALIKLNETKINSINKSEAISFALKANPKIKNVYIVSVSNYLKQIEYQVSKVETTEDDI